MSMISDKWIDGVKVAKERVQKHRDSVDRRILDLSKISLQTLRSQICASKNQFENDMSSLIGTKVLKRAKEIRSVIDPILSRAANASAEVKKARWNLKDRETLNMYVDHIEKMKEVLAKEAARLEKYAKLKTEVHRAGEEAASPKKAKPAAIKKSKAKKKKTAKKATAKSSSRNASAGKKSVGKKVSGRKTKSTKKVTTAKARAKASARKRVAR